MPRIVKTSRPTLATRENAEHSDIKDNYEGKESPTQVN